MGYAIAEAARDRGAPSRSSAGPSRWPRRTASRVSVTTAEEMRDAVERATRRLRRADHGRRRRRLPPGEHAEQKIKRTGESMTLELVPTPDILAGRRRGRS